MLQRLLRRCSPIFARPEFRTLLLLNILLGLAYSFVAPFMSMWGTLEVKMSSLRFGVFMTATALSGIGFGTVLAHYSDTRYSRRKILLLGSATGTLGYIGYAFFRDFTPLLLTGIFVLGISSITFSQVFALAREQLGHAKLPPGENAFYMNVFRMFFALSWTVGPAVASWIMVAYSFKVLFLCAAAVFAAFHIVVRIYVPENLTAFPNLNPVPKVSLTNVLKRWDVLAHFAGFVLIFASSTIGMMNLPLLVLQNLGGTEKDVGIIYSVSPVFELPLMFYFGLLATKMDPAKIIRMGMVIGVIYFGLLTLVQAPWHVYPAQILSAALVAIISGVAITYFQNYLPHHPGTATNLYATAQRIGSTFGYMLFGSLAYRFSHRDVFIFCTGFSLVALGLLYVPARPDEPDASLPDAAKDRLAA